MQSLLFQNDALLASIAADTGTQGPRISSGENRTDPAVRKVQLALLEWDPGCLPDFGPDGDFGPESTEAIIRFKHEELGVVGDVVGDVGPLSVARLDEIQAAREGALVGHFLAFGEEGVAAPGGELWQAVVDAGGTVALGLGSYAAVIAGDTSVFDAAFAVPAVSYVLRSWDTPPADFDADTVELALSWLRTFDPAFVLARIDPSREGGDWSEGMCMPEQAG